MFLKGVLRGFDPGPPANWEFRGAVEAAQQAHHLLVLRLVESEAAVLDGDLHSEGAELAQAIDHRFGVLAGLVDRDRINHRRGDPIRK